MPFQVDDVEVDLISGHLLGLNCMGSSLNGFLLGGSLFYGCRRI